MLSIQNRSPKLSVRQLKAARALVGWSQAELARKSGISEPTIRRLESQEGELGGLPSTIEAIRRALEDNGVRFIARGVELKG
jgi:transcriptional regulator with XRE-family HTH domain